MEDRGRSFAQFILSLIWGGCTAGVRDRHKGTGRWIGLGCMRWHFQTLNKVLFFFFFFWMMTPQKLHRRFSTQLPGCTSAGQHLLPKQLFTLFYTAGNVSYLFPQMCESFPSLLEGKFLFRRKCYSTIRMLFLFCLTATTTTEQKPGTSNPSIRKRRKVGTATQIPWTCCTIYLRHEFQASERPCFQ